MLLYLLNLYGTRPQRQLFGRGKTDSNADRQIISALLGATVAKEFGEGNDVRLDSQVDLAKHDPDFVVAQEKEKHEAQERFIRETKAAWHQMEDELGIAHEIIDKHARFEKDGVVWEGNCNIFRDKENFKAFPPHWKEVTGELDISYAGIQSLNGCPDVSVLDCSNCHKLASLKHCPTSVTTLNCWSCPITSLEDCPTSVTTLDCSYCPKLASLEHCPPNLDFLDVRNIPATTISKGLHIKHMLIYKSQTELIADATEKGYYVIISA